MRVNYHTHTYRCKHAYGIEEDYVLNAIEKNLSILGFSDHGPFKDYNYSLRMDFNELEEYILTINNLKEKYDDKITIKSGLEIEYLPDKIPYYKELLKEYKLDYLVLGQHFYKNENNKFINTYIIEDSSEFLNYAKVIIEGMKTGLFKFLAHPDVIFVNNVVWDNNCDKFCDLIVNSAKENDFTLEFNANGIRKGKKDFYDGTRYAYPHKKFWEKVAKENIKVIINSDCHSPEQIWDNNMDLAYKEAKDLGLNIVTEIF